MRNYKVSYEFTCMDNWSQNYRVVLSNNTHKFKTYNEASEFTKKLINNHYATIRLVGKPTIILPSENSNA